MEERLEGWEGSDLAWREAETGSSGASTASTFAFWVISGHCTGMVILINDDPVID